ncbi:TIGR03757 family integrating conjugative element protein [Serratia sp. 1D1416]|uniref:TIGR03757 family integrating conjugative element protein n=1 Tax=Serratia sp. 1D1416 TaxID=2447890 RepID=UPI001F5DE2C3|nr:TIGR03757 family integrating conjugative element protein [Serratia sp. 1D1416]
MLQPLSPPVLHSPTSPKVAGIALLLSMLTINAYATTDVRVYTDKNFPLVASQDAAAVIYMDAAQELEAGLTAGLPVDPVQAESLLRQRLQDGEQVLQLKLAAAYQGITEAWGLGITKLPAVVVDRRYVVYGEPDVARAVQRIEAYRRAYP